MRGKSGWKVVVAQAIAGFAVVALAGVGFSALGGRPRGQGISSRSFEFQYVVRVPALPVPSDELKIWIPLPPSDAHQHITDLHLTSPVPCRTHQEELNGNRFAFCQLNAAHAARPFDITLTFRAQRYEYRVALPMDDPSPSIEALPPAMARFLRPDRLVPIDGVIGNLSREQTAGITDPIEKARKIYDYVIHTMHYDHEGTGWGRGDAVWACSSRHGNCTDFHSLFIGMARAAGLPARFEIGFPLPQDRHQGEISGYHCWAEFYVEGIGWIPIDAAEAWQMPDKRDYFFGALDDNRVRFTRGRDLVLNPAQDRGPVNFVVYPYAEIDGKPFVQLRHEFSFRDLTP